MQGSGPTPRVSSLRVWAGPEFPVMLPGTCSSWDHRPWLCCHLPDRCAPQCPHLGHESARSKPLMKKTAGKGGESGYRDQEQKRDRRENGPLGNDLNGKHSGSWETCGYVSSLLGLSGALLPGGLWVYLVSVVTSQFLQQMCTRVVQAFELCCPVTHHVCVAVGHLEWGQSQLRCAV